MRANFRCKAIRRWYPLSVCSCRCFCSASQATLVAACWVVRNVLSLVGQAVRDCEFAKRSKLIHAYDGPVVCSVGARFTIRCHHAR